MEQKKNIDYESREPRWNGKDYKLLNHDLYVCHYEDVIAEYIIRNNKIKLKELGLQKLLYFIQLESFEKYKKPMMKAPSFIKYRHGAVDIYLRDKFISQVYMNLVLEPDDILGAKMIVKDDFKAVYVPVFYNEYIIKEEDKKLINKVLKKYEGLSDWDLVEHNLNSLPVRLTPQGEIIDIKKYYL